MIKNLFKQYRRAPFAVATVMGFVLAALAVLATCAPNQAFAETRSVVKQGTVDTFCTYIEPPTAALRPDAIEEAIANGKVTLACEDEKVQLQENGAVWYMGTFTASTTPYEVPTYKITYGDAIILTDGTTADFVLTVTNEQFYVTSTGSLTNTVLFAEKGKSSAVVNSVNMSSFAKNGTGYISDARDIKISVEKNGEPVDCSLLLSMVDIDLEGVLNSQLGTNTNNVTWSYKSNEASYLESVFFNADDEGLLSDIYVPTTSYLNVVTENNQVKLLPTQGDLNTYNSGFAVLISGKGATVHWEGSACYSSFTLPDVSLAYNIAAEVTKNSVGNGPGFGSITTKASYADDNVQSVSTDNANKTYKSALNITHGTNAVCTITPDEGYVIDTFTIDGSVVTPPARNTDGTYTYTFTDNANHTIAASFGIEQTVTYKASENGSVDKATETVVQGHTPAGATPTANEGYVFNKWVADKAVTLSDGTEISSGDTITQAQLTNVVITEDVTFTAKFKVGSAYTINYVLDGGTNASTNPDDYTVETPTITLADPARVGYTFTGWTTSGITTPTKALTIPKGSTGEKIFTAHWSINSCTVDFDLRGGTDGVIGEPATATQHITYGSTATKPHTDPMKDGLRFVGWYTSPDVTDESKYDFDSPVTGDMTLYAKWQAYVSYYANADNDGGFVAYDFVDEGDYARRPTEKYVKEGYSFAGWYDTSDFSGSEFDFENTPIMKDTSLYVKWVKDNEPDPTPDPDPEPEEEVTLSRIAGEDADQTAAAISKESFDSSKYAIIARWDDFADALGASGLAGTLDCPILLTQLDTLSQATIDELERLGAETVYVIGGTGAISEQIDKDLDGIVTVKTHERIWGEYSWDTSLECAEAIAEHDGNPSSEAIVAVSYNFQDALSISSYAYAHKVPLILEDNSYGVAGTLTDDAVSFIESTTGTIWVAGGYVAVGKETVEDVFTERDITRLWGWDGYDTSNQIATHMTKEGLLSASVVGIASGGQKAYGVDALAGAALIGKQGGVMLLANSNPEMEEENYTTIDQGTDSQNTPSFLITNYSDVKHAYMLGGTVVAPESFFDKVKTILGV